MWSLLLNSVILMGLPQPRIFYDSMTKVSLARANTSHSKLKELRIFDLFLLTNNHSVLYDYTRKVNP